MRPTALKRRAKRIGNRFSIVRSYLARHGIEGRIRGEAGIETRTYPGYGRWDHVVPLPPLALIQSTGPESLEVFLVVGDAWYQTVSRYLPAGATVLDVGCGCGKLARFLVAHPHVERYVGFDPIRENIDWARAHIEPLAADRFTFLHYDLYSRVYNRAGTMRASELVFPTEDDVVDLVVAASVFTHLLEDDAIHYLNETARVLAPRGVAVVSLHTSPPSGEAYAGDEARIDVDLDYFEQLAARCRLRSQRLGELCGQEAVLLRPA